MTVFFKYIYKYGGGQAVSPRAFPKPLHCWEEGAVSAFRAWTEGRNYHISGWMGVSPCGLRKKTQQWEVLHLFSHEFSPLEGARLTKKKEKWKQSAGFTAFPAATWRQNQNNDDSLGGSCWSQTAKACQVLIKNINRLCIFLIFFLQNNIYIIEEEKTQTLRQRC